ncbi:MAG: ABC transporter permease, partial [Terriglobia bacterium]
RESMLLAVDTLRSHKLRSFLTIVGVLIGTATVILVASIITGLERQVSEIARQFGTETVYVYKFQPGIHFHLTPEERMRKPVTYEQAMAVAQQCPDVREVALELVKWGSVPPVIKYRGQEMVDGNLLGATPNDFAVSNAELAEGRLFTSTENRHRRNVAVIGSDVVKMFFAHEDPIGRTIDVGGHNFQVIGTLGPRKEFLIDTGDNRLVYIPYLTYRDLYPAMKDNFILAVAFPGRRSAAIDEITGVLRRVRGDRPWQPSSFGLSTADSFIQQFNAIIGTTALAMIVLSSIGLLVGGIGVMNIMLVSVTERTREIGVRKAIGARRKDISWQFLLEAMTLTGAGGLIGIAAGWAASLIIRSFVPKLPSAVPLWAVAAGFIVSVGVGLFFGLWPAVKAARLDPIVALRYE